MEKTVLNAVGVFLDKNENGRRITKIRGYFSEIAYTRD